MGTGGYSTAVAIISPLVWAIPWWQFTCFVGVWVLYEPHTNSWWSVVSDIIPNLHPNWFKFTFLTRRWSTSFLMPCFSSNSVASLQMLETNSELNLGSIAKPEYLWESVLWMKNGWLWRTKVKGPNWSDNIPFLTLHILSSLKDRFVSSDLLSNLYTGALANMFHVLKTRL